MQLQIRGEVEADKDQEKKRAVNVATRSLERDLERLKADHATEIEQMLERHKQELSDNKKKQWVRSVFYIYISTYLSWLTNFKKSCILRTNFTSAIRSYFSTIVVFY